MLVKFHSYELCAGGFRAERADLDSALVAIVSWTVIVSQMVHHLGAWLAEVLAGDGTGRALVVLCPDASLAVGQPFVSLSFPLHCTGRPSRRWALLARGWAPPCQKVELQGW